MSEIRCPNCGSIKAVKTTKGKIKEVAAEFAGGLAQGATKQLANTYAFDGAGHLVPKFGHSLARLVSVDFVCSDCYQMFKVKFDSDDIVQDIVKDTKYTLNDIKLHKNQEIGFKEAMYKKKKRSVTINWILAALSALYSICCIQYPAAIVVGIFLCIIFAAVAYNRSKQASEIQDEIFEISGMTANEYRYRYM